QESLDFHQRVFEGYQIIKEKYQERMIVFDATMSIEALSQAVYDAIVKWVNIHEQSVD
ncbi:MAG: dTMP kinase, partial [Erysipelothrix sp.]|nr:dTMP kinase [Erysipelothrix sp.]